MKFKVKEFLIGIILGLFLVIVIRLAQPVQVQGCGGGCGWKYITPTITETPTQEFTPTPTLSDCSGNFQFEDVPDKCITPTVTPTPTIEQNNTPSGSTGSTGGGSTSPASPPGAATCIIPFAAPIVQGWTFGTVPNSLIYSWWASTEPGIQSQSIQYGYAPDNMPYGVPNLSADTTWYQIGDLAPGKHVWAAVTAYKNGCGETSQPFDPYLPFIF